MADIRSFKTERPSKLDPRQALSDGPPFLCSPNQKWLLVAIAKDKDGNTCPAFCGTVKTVLQAKKYIKAVRDAGWVHFDIHYVKLGPFTVFPPPAETTKIEYHQEKLQGLMGRHLQELDNAADRMDRRVRAAKAEEAVHQSIRQKIEEKTKGAASIVKGALPPGAIVAKPVHLNLFPRVEKKEEKDSASAGAVTPVEQDPTAVAASAAPAPAAAKKKKKKQKNKNKKNHESAAPGGPPGGAAEEEENSPGGDEISASEEDAEE